MTPPQSPFPSAKDPSRARFFRDARHDPLPVESFHRQGFKMGSWGGARRGAEARSFEHETCPARPKPGPPSFHARRQPRNRSNGRCELTGPDRKLPGRATRGGCSGSVPRTPCPCGPSAVHAPVGRQTYLQPSWDERAPSRPTYQRPDSLPQSPRGFASSSSRSFRQRHCHSPLTRIGCLSTHPARFAGPCIPRRASRESLKPRREPGRRLGRRERRGTRGSGASTAART